MANVRRTGQFLKPDCSRVLLRAFSPNSEQRSLKMIARIGALSESDVAGELDVVLERFEKRHLQLCAFFLRRFDQLKPLLLTDSPISEARKLLIGAYFSQEYSLECAALFNPSIVWSPDQSGLPPGSRRFIVSLRATGEGHISSIIFRQGVVDAENRLTIETPSRFVTAPEITANPTYELALFKHKLYELDHADDFTETVLSTLKEYFSYEELKASVRQVERQSRKRNGGEAASSRSLLTLAQANYKVSYSPERPISERVIFPTSSTEINGIEDARFVQFQEEDGRIAYYATYTAYDGKTAMPQMLMTEDFLHFEMSTLNGPEVQNKGMALFPRKIDGQYAMISRQDNENIYLMFSDNLHFWYSKEILLKPTFSWEFVQLGNCGSPIETDAGWLLLTHGVGAMRQYSIGAILLDKNDPSKVIGRLREPLLTPNDQEREGYVPNVVYSCGSQIHNGELLMPYAMSDYGSSFAFIPLEEILGGME